MINCIKCNSANVSHEIKEGRGLPPKNYTHPIISKRISWKGIWDIWVCGDCGEKISKLRR